MSASRARRWLLLVTLAAVALAPAAARAQATPARKYALVVGINGYDHSKFRNLEYAENDANKLSTLLQKHNYEVTQVTGEDATLARIQKELKARTTRRNRHELVLVAFAGHGLFFPDKNGSYFCPRDAEPSDPSTMLALAEVYRDLSECGAGAELVDACREEAVRGAARTRGVDSALQAPPGVGVLFSCSPGQFAFESPEYKHGVFFYHVLQALGGKAKEDDGEVTWDGLRSYVKRQVSRDVARLYPGARQVPNEVSNLADIPPLLKASPFIQIPSVAKLQPGTPLLSAPLAAAAEPWQKLNGSWAGLYHYPATANRPPVRFQMTMNHDGRVFTARVKEPNTFTFNPKVDPNEPFLYANCRGTFDRDQNRLTFTKVYDGTAGADGTVTYSALLLQGTRLEGTWVIRTPGRPDFRGVFSVRKDD